MPLAVGTLVLEAFGGGELLAIDITKLVPLVFLLYMDFPCLCNNVLNLSTHTTGTPERGGDREHVK